MAPFEPLVQLSRLEMRLIFSIYMDNLGMAISALDDGADLTIMDDEDNPLLIAIERGNYDIVSLLLDRGVVVEYIDDILFSRYKKDGHSDILTLLVKRMTNDVMWDILVNLSLSRRYEDIDILVSNGIDINVRGGCDEETVLSYLSDARDIGPEELIFLLDRGADTSIVNKDGRSVYDIANIQAKNIIGSRARSMHTCRYRSPTYMSSVYEDTDIIFV
jgi:ankyrin repeat protein